jgi:hypothetical protein
MSKLSRIHDDYLDPDKYLGDDEPPDKPGYITNIQQLADSIGCSIPRIGKALFKGTKCGIVFKEIHNLSESLNAPYHSGVSVCGYAEGADAECLPIELLYPFTPEVFWEAVELADEQGCELFTEWND